MDGGGEAGPEVCGLLGCGVGETWDLGGGSGGGGGGGWLGLRGEDEVRRDLQVLGFRVRREV